MAKYTQGEWRVSGIPTYDNANVMRVFAGAQYVGTVGGKDQAPEEIAANAELIAMAPEMLSTIEDLVKQLKFASQTVSPQSDGWTDLWKAERRGREILQRAREL